MLHCCSAACSTHAPAKTKLIVLDERPYCSTSSARRSTSQRRAHANGSTPRDCSHAWKRSRRVDDEERPAVGAAERFLETPAAATSTALAAAAAVAGTAAAAAAAEGSCTDRQADSSAFSSSSVSGGAATIGAPPAALLTAEAAAAARVTAASVTCSCSGGALAAAGAACSSGAAVGLRPCRIASTATLSAARVRFGSDCACGGPTAVAICSSSGESPAAHAAAGALRFLLVNRWLLKYL
jgi:hypothetical protein